MIQTIFREDLFKEKVALVTGGGTGIGLRTARELVALGARVVIASRKEEHLEAGLAAIEPGRAHAVACNIRDPQSVEDCIQETLNWGGSLDLLVNNAGGQFPSPAAEISAKGWHAVIETNLTGTFHMCRQAFLKTMAGNGGSIVNVIANMWRGFPLMAHTGAARAGVDNLTKSLAVEWGRHGVRVNAVAPGVIHSSGLDKYDERFKPIVHAAARNNQTWRLGTEAEVASAILFLLSPAATFITGETLKVDGGDSLFHPMYPPTENTANPAFDDLPDPPDED